MDYLDYIAGIIKEHLNVDVTKETSRKTYIVDARKIFCDLARDLTLYSYSEIGDYIKKNHATVIHLKNSSENLKEFDKNYLKKYNLCLYFINKDPKPKDQCIEEAYKHHLQKARFYKRILNRL